MARRRALLIVSALVFYGAFIARTSFVVLGQRWFVLFEDAMISMRYAKNFASGSGLVWNAGEAPVEGYTNFLWTLWMAFVHTLGLPDSKVSLAIMLTGVGILVANAFVVERMCARVTGLERTSWPPFVAMASVLFYYPLVFWTLRGMEVGAVTLVIDALILLALSMEDGFSVARAVGMGVLGAAAILIRSDALVSVGVVTLYAAATAPRRTQQISVLGAVGLFVGAAALGQLAYRRGVYHETLPNTYYLKLLHVPLVARLKRGIFVAVRVLTFQLAVPLSALAAGLAMLPRPAGWWRTKATRQLALLLVVCGVQASYAVYVGGDAWEWMLYSNRYMTVAMPAFIVLLTALLARTFEAVRDDAALRATGAKVFVRTLAGSGVCLLALNAYARAFAEHGIARTIFPSGSTILAGVLYLVAAGALSVSGGALKGRVVAAFAALGTPRAAAVGIAMALVVWVPANFHPLLTWAAHNADQFNDEARYARLGLLIGATTSKETRLAVVAAGATPYFSMRPSEDMLGKNDAVIAKKAPVGVFSPGHDKWDYRYTLGERAPAIMVELLDVTPADSQYIASLGFVPLANGVYVRQNATGIDRDLLGAAFDTDVALDAALLRAQKESATASTLVR